MTKQLTIFNVQMPMEFVVTEGQDSPSPYLRVLVKQDGSSRLQQGFRFINEQGNLDMVFKNIPIVIEPIDPEVIVPESIEDPIIVEQSEECQAEA